MAARLLLVAAAPTADTRTATFGADGPLLHPDAVRTVQERVAAWWSGPEQACRQTCERLGRPGQVLAELRGPGFGSWAGRRLADVGGTDPAGVRAWLTDPDAVPHGGESLAALVTRVGALAEAHPWPEGRSVVVVAPLVARALLVHALGASPAVLFRVDVAPLGRVLLSRAGAAWRLQGLSGPD